MSRTVNDPKHVGTAYWLPCPECDHKTKHEVIAYVTAAGPDDNVGYVWEEYEILQCRRCEEITFRQDWRSADDEE